MIPLTDPADALRYADTDGHPSEDKQQMATRDADVHAWSRSAAAALRTGDYGRVDMLAVAEELERMGASERRLHQSAGDPEDLSHQVAHLRGYGE